MSDLNEAKDLLDLMDKWLVPPIVAENEQLKARVLALEAERDGLLLTLDQRGERINSLSAEVARLTSVLDEAERAETT